MTMPLISIPAADDTAYRVNGSSAAATLTVPNILVLCLCSIETNFIILPRPRIVIDFSRKIASLVTTICVNYQYYLKLSQPS